MDIDFSKLTKGHAQGIFAAQENLMGNLPVKSNCLDIIFAGEIIEHLIDTDHFLDEIHRVLKKSGSLVLTTPNLCNLENRLRILMGLYPILLITLPEEIITSGFKTKGLLSDRSEKETLILLR